MLIGWHLPKMYSIYIKSFSFRTTEGRKYQCSYLFSAKMINGTKIMKVYFRPETKTKTKFIQQNYQKLLFSMPKGKTKVNFGRFLNQQATVKVRFMFELCNHLFSWLHILHIYYYFFTASI